MEAGPEQLRDWMDRRQVNQVETAAILELNEVFLSQILNRQRRPGLANAVKIERGTGIPAESWLLTEIRNGDEDEAPVAAKRRLAKR